MSGIQSRLASSALLLEIPSGAYRFQLIFFCAGRTFDQNKSQEEGNNKENENVYKERRSGRGRGRGMGRGRGRGGSAPRHNRQVTFLNCCIFWFVMLKNSLCCRHRQPGMKSDGGSIFQSDSADAFQDPVDVWENPKPSVKCWDIEVRFT